MTIEILEDSESYSLMKVLDSPEVYRLTMSDSVGFLRNSYILRSDKDVMIIDPPFMSLSGYKVLEKIWIELEIEKYSLHVFCTHFHVAYFKERLAALPKDAHVYLSGYESVPEDIDRQRGYQNMRFRKEGYPKPLLDVWNGPKIEKENMEDVPVSAQQSDGNIHVTMVYDGCSIRMGDWKLTCHYTPGHTIGHMCLGLKEKGILFSGDTVLLDDLPFVGIWKGKKCALDDLMMSLEKLDKENYHIIFPAHGNYEIQGKQRVKEMMNRYYFRILEMYRLVYDHPGKNAYQLSHWFCHCHMSWDAASPKKQWYAMGETLAYLIYLRERKYVCSSRGENGMINVPGKRKITDY